MYLSEKRVGKSREGPPIQAYQGSRPRISRRLIERLEEAFALNAVSRFDVYRKKKRLEVIPRWGLYALYVIGAMILVLSAFQLFLRYEYITTNGAVMRIDRLTQQSCRMEGAECVAPSTPKFSTSTSTSLSISPSLDSKAPKPKKH